MLSRLIPKPYVRLKDLAAALRDERWEDAADLALSETLRGWPKAEAGRIQAGRGLLERAQEAYNEGHLEAAINVVRRARDCLGDDPDAVALENEIKKALDRIEAEQRRAEELWKRFRQGGHAQTLADDLEAIAQSTGSLDELRAQVRSALARLGEYVKEAEALARRGDLPGAKNLARRALRISSRDVKAQLLCSALNRWEEARAFADEGRYDRAISLIDELLGEHEDWPVLSTELEKMNRDRRIAAAIEKDLAAARERKDEAEMARLLDRLAQVCPKHPEVPARRTKPSFRRGLPAGEPFILLLESKRTGRSAVYAVATRPVAYLGAASASGGASDALRLRVKGFQSRAGASLVLHDGAFVLRVREGEDVEINGERIERHELRDGDVIACRHGAECRVREIAFEQGHSAIMLEPASAGQTDWADTQTPSPVGPVEFVIVHDGTFRLRAPDFDADGSEWRFDQEGVEIVSAAGVWLRGESKKDASAVRLVPWGTASVRIGDDRATFLGIE